MAARSHLIAPASNVATARTRSKNPAALSIVPPTFAPLPLRVAQIPVTRFSFGAKHLLARIHLLAGFRGVWGDKDLHYPTLTFLAEELGCSSDSVRLYVDQLRSAGLVAFERTSSGRYIFRVDAGQRQREQFLQLPLGVMRLPRSYVSFGAKLLYAYLKFRGRNGDAYPSVTTIGRDIGCNRRNVHNLLDEAEAKLNVSHRRQKRTSSRYFIGPFAEVVAKCEASISESAKTDQRLNAESEDLAHHTPEDSAHYQPRILHNKSSRILHTEETNTEEKTLLEGPRTYGTFFSPTASGVGSEPDSDSQQLAKTIKGVSCAPNRSPIADVIYRYTEKEPNGNVIDDIRRIEKAYDDDEIAEILEGRARNAKDKPRSAKWFLTTWRNYVHEAQSLISSNPAAARSRAELVPARVPKPSATNGHRSTPSRFDRAGIEERALAHYEREKPWLLNSVFDYRGAFCNFFAYFPEPFEGWYPAELYPEDLTDSEGLLIEALHGVDSGEDTAAFWRQFWFHHDAGLPFNVDTVKANFVRILLTLEKSAPTYEWHIYEPNPADFVCSWRRAYDSEPLSEWEIRDVVDEADDLGLYQRFFDCFPASDLKHWSIDENGTGADEDPCFRALILAINGYRPCDYGDFLKSREELLQAANRKAAEGRAHAIMNHLRECIREGEWENGGGRSMIDFLTDVSCLLIEEDLTPTPSRQMRGLKER